MIVIPLLSSYMSGLSGQDPGRSTCSRSCKGFGSRLSFLTVAAVVAVCEDFFSSGLDGKWSCTAVDHATLPSCSTAWWNGAFFSFRIRRADCFVPDCRQLHWALCARSLAAAMTYSYRFLDVGVAVAADISERFELSIVVAETSSRTNDGHKSITNKHTKHILALYARARIMSFALDAGCQSSNSPWRPVPHAACQWRRHLSHASRQRHRDYILQPLLLRRLSADSWLTFLVFSSLCTFFSWIRLLILQHRHIYYHLRSSRLSVLFLSRFGYLTICIAFSSYINFSLLRFSILLVSLISVFFFTIRYHYV